MWRRPKRRCSWRIPMISCMRRSAFIRSTASASRMQTLTLFAPWRQIRRSRRLAKSAWIIIGKNVHRRPRRRASSRKSCCANSWSWRGSCTCRLSFMTERRTRTVLILSKSFPTSRACITAIPAAWKWRRKSSSWGGICRLPASSPTARQKKPAASSKVCPWTAS